MWTRKYLWNLQRGPNILWVKAARSDFCIFCDQIYLFNREHDHERISLKEEISLHPLRK